MVFMPSLAKPLLLAFAPAFTKPTFQRWLLLLLTAVLIWRLGKQREKLRLVLCFPLRSRSFLLH